MQYVTSNEFARSEMSIHRADARPAAGRRELSLDVEVLEARIAPGCIPYGPFALGEGAADTADAGADAGTQDTSSGSDEVAWPPDITSTAA